MINSREELGAVDWLETLNYFPESFDLKASYSSVFERTKLSVLSGSGVDKVIGGEVALRPSSGIDVKVNYNTSWPESRIPIHYRNDTKGYILAPSIWQDISCTEVALNSLAAVKVSDMDQGCQYLAIIGTHGSIVASGVGEVCSNDENLDVVDLGAQSGLLEGDSERVVLDSLWSYIHNQNFHDSAMEWMEKSNREHYQIPEGVSVEEFLRYETHN